MQNCKLEYLIIIRVSDAAIVMLSMKDINYLEVKKAGTQKYFLCHDSFVNNIKI